MPLGTAGPGFTSTLEPWKGFARPDRSYKVGLLIVGRPSPGLARCLPDGLLQGHVIRAQIAGIDFGTSNSAIAVGIHVRASLSGQINLLTFKCVHQVPGKKRPRIIEHQPSGRATLPSVVNFPAEDVVLVGEEAQQ